MHVLLFGNKFNEEVCRGFIFANLFNSLYLLVRLWWNVLVANLAINFQNLVAKVKNLVALAPVLGAISRPALGVFWPVFCFNSQNSFSKVWFFWPVAVLRQQFRRFWGNAHFCYKNNFCRHLKAQKQSVTQLLRNTELPNLQANSWSPTRLKFGRWRLQSECKYPAGLFPGVLLIWNSEWQ